MALLYSGLIVIFLTVLCPAPANSLLPTAEDFPRGLPAQLDDCAEILKNIDAKRPLVIQIPDSDKLLRFLREHRAGEIRRCLRKLRGTRDLQQANKTSVKPEGTLSYIDRLYLTPGYQCGRSIPTRQEFQRMLKEKPADALQILRRCNVPIRSISPIRQLPVGRRQLPVDTRQRPVGTW